MARNKGQKSLTTTLNDARDAVTPAAESAMDKLSSATEQAISAVQTSVMPALADAKDRVGPALADAKDRVGPALEEARDALIPAATEALAAGKEHGHKAAVKLGLADEPKKKKHRIRKLLIALGIAGAAAFIYRKVSGGGEPSWVAAPGPSSSGPGSHAAGAAGAGTTDAAGVDKSETAPTAPLASEETVESPVPSTPDEPLEEHRV